MCIIQINQFESVVEYDATRWQNRKVEARLLYKIPSVGYLGNVFTIQIIVNAFLPAL